LDTVSAEELVLRCRQSPRGDTRAFEVLVETYKQRVFATALRITGNRHDAEDAAQDVFLKIYRNIKSLADPASLTSWIYTITTNTCYDIMSTKSHSASLSLSPTEQEDGEERYSDLASLTPEDAAVQSELRRCLEDALRHLDTSARTTIVLRDIEERPYQEIASNLKIGLSAIKMRIHRAREAFRHALLKVCPDAWQQS
jgi:RNA polymerase sigma-70 factor (ECF subfamily)